MAKQRRRVVKEEPRKDSRSKRVNFDNARVDKLEKDGFRDPACTSKSNDVRWYAHNPELLRSAASLAFSQTTGTMLPWTTPEAVPGVLAVNWCPCLCGAGDDPVNQAKDSIYSYVVHANSRNTSYDAGDLMLTILAGAQLFSFIGLGIRAYGMARLYDQTNAYLPEALLAASGFDATNLRSNLSQMWFDINELVARSAQIWIPNNLPITERWFWLNSNVYMDSETVKGQYYMFNPQMVYLFDETSTTGTSLQTRTWGSGTLHTWEQYMTLVNELFSALVDSQDRGVMFGDILKAYGADKIYSLSPITADYMLKPVYDKEVLTQIENSTSFGSAMGAVSVDPNNGTIFQLGSTVNDSAWTSNVKSGNVLCTGKSVLNFHQKDLPTPEQIMVATRLTCLGNLVKTMTYGGTATNQWIPATSGTEVVVTYKLFYFSFTGGTKALSSVIFRTITADNLAIGTVRREVAFDWAPFMYVMPVSSIPATQTTPGAIQTFIPSSSVGDYDYYTILDIDTLQKMHTTAVYSEFGVPVIG